MYNTRIMQRMIKLALMCSDERHCVYKSMIKFGLELPNELR